ncbi:UDP-N-acetylmuramoylalanyl-D-glutamate--2,6-diaminopimelate ligase [Baumannia cicadellinicola str. Hc (Homalodisca coagulata)]|uniref:UDP-N-acetylmuramoyl-L-alanyl-D-glutamate--2,6-diaminopimelate ligase n=2 Tax=Candidatus Palibaumannia cicadellinicola TaxID=186490 RepID=Q1LSW1_BAUCH|nr:UDP-N-acetylmuramoyl-L-alanyl-D-glutamate--2,6-diaminopimelate ligase [Candidatus Baumannia cicadellinicola]ABF14169.1 UDP-N-acetylmuramoylalanyl-D-glutamate--2,6-diaminopimelate ligase [Baumannia cicadellinicola str. Hc (Homalodisca coagulata)]MCJ7462185.1 UDP-N-acetylmuramoyl-L-alanyl-D-glutamate--2,6-diaminopimelate ligase [Candidatus Baumannia cicadellinicola]
MTLRELLAPWIKQIPFECLITGISMNSMTAQYGDLFIAIQGHKQDGRDYIPSAIAKGVAAILAEAKGQTKHGEIHKLHDVPIIYFNQLNKMLSAIAGHFYQQPSRFLRLIGITGTNGKTTISYLLANWLSLLGETSAVMGTIGNGIFGNLNASNNTTSSAIEIQRFLRQVCDQGVKFSIIEVSSHGLVQDRVSNLNFAAAVFSNLSQDHLDYHLDMVQYEKAKWKLFSELNVSKRIINVDDTVGKNWLVHLPQAVAVTANNSIPHNWPGYWLCARKIIHHTSGVNINFNSYWGSGEIYSNLIGEFNVSNILLSLATLLVLGYSLKNLVKTSRKLQAICGRMEVFSAHGWPVVIVDYAHTPDALAKALLAVKMRCQGKIWCIFGCGGNRDKSKRPIMGAIAEEYADYIIITNDNPRWEEPQDIIEDIKCGFINGNHTNKTVILCRSLAIQHAIIHASPQDIILIAGKGHENYQIIKGKQFYYSDRIVVSNMLKLEV